MDPTELSRLITDNCKYEEITWLVVDPDHGGALPKAGVGRLRDQRSQGGQCLKLALPVILIILKDKYITSV